MADIEESAVKSLTQDGETVALRSAADEAAKQQLDAHNSCDTGAESSRNVLANSYVYFTPAPPQ